jgi:hypothetical protein
MFNRRSLCLLALAIAPLTHAVYVTVEGDCTSTTPTPTPYPSNIISYMTISTTETECDCTDMTPTPTALPPAPATAPAASPPAAVSMAPSAPIASFVPYTGNYTTPLASSPAVVTPQVPVNSGANYNLVNMGGAIVVLAITGFALM